VTLSLSDRLVQDLAAVIQISTLPIFHARQDLAFGDPVRPEFIGHNDSWHVAQTLQQLAKERFAAFVLRRS
jgi:hypothetical protein